MKKRQTQNTDNNKLKSKRITIPYVQGTAEKIGRILRGEE